MDNITYIVDEIIENKVKLENINTKEIKIELLDILPGNIHEGSVLIFQDDKYIIDKNTEEKRRISLRERLNKLKKDWVNEKSRNFTKRYDEKWKARK